MSESIFATIKGNNGTCVKQWFLKEFGVSRSVLHREDGPAVIEFDCDTGEEQAHHYYYHGVLHRLDGPAFERFTLFPHPDIEGAEMIEPWYRVYGDPIDVAVQQAHATGKITDEQLEEITSKIEEKQKLEVFATALGDDAI